MELEAVPAQTSPALQSILLAPSETKHQRVAIMPQIDTASIVPGLLPTLRMSEATIPARSASEDVKITALNASNNPKLASGFLLDPRGANKQNA